MTSTVNYYKHNNGYAATSANGASSRIALNGKHKNKRESHVNNNDEDGGNAQRSDEEMRDKRDNDIL